MASDPLLGCLNRCTCLHPLASALASFGVSGEYDGRSGEYCGEEVGCRLWFLLFHLHRLAVGV